VEPAALEALLAEVLAHAGVRPVLGTAPPPGVEVERRPGRDHDHLFVFNHTAPAIEVIRETAGGTWEVRPTP
jgi:hypothetical protein